MAETPSSQPQQTAPRSPFQMFGFPFPQMPAFDPAAMSFAGVSEAWQKAVADQQARIASMFEEYAKSEEKGATDARRAVEEMARLSLATIDYAREMSANLRKSAMEMAKKAAETSAAPVAAAPVASAPAAAKKA